MRAREEVENFDFEKVDEVATEPTAEEPTAATETPDFCNQNFLGARAEIFQPEIVSTTTADDYDRKAFDEFFSEPNAVVVEQFAMTENVTTEKVYQLGTEVMNDWQLTKPRHRDLYDAKTHLLNTIRRKIEIGRQRKPTSRQESRQRLIDYSNRLLQQAALGMFEKEDNTPKPF